MGMEEQVSFVVRMIVTPSERAELEAAARDERRSLSNLVTAWAVEKLAARRKVQAGG